jgi:hypothetical protein
VDGSFRVWECCRNTPGDKREGDEVAWTGVSERGNAVGTLRGTSVRETKSRGREFPSVGMLSEHSEGRVSQRDHVHVASRASGSHMTVGV